MWAPGGAMTVQLSLEQETVGKKVLWPMLLPCVETTEPRSDTALKVPDVTVNVTDSSYPQSVFVIVNAGRARPERRYGGKDFNTVFFWEFVRRRIDVVASGIRSGD
jgi:hypothetical protein